MIDFGEHGKHEPGKPGRRDSVHARDLGAAFAEGFLGAFSLAFLILRPWAWRHAARPSTPRDAHETAEARVAANFRRAGEHIESAISAVEKKPMA